MELNPFWQPRLEKNLECSWVDEVRQVHESIPGYEKSPLLRVDSLLVKYEGARFYAGGSFKPLGVSFACHRLGERIRVNATLVAATEGNHGRAVAWTAKQRGCEAVIFVPEHTSRQRREAIQNEGARVEVVAGDYDRAVRCAAQEASRPDHILISDMGFEGYTEIPDSISAGYCTLFREVDEELEQQGEPGPDFVFLQAGVGSFAAGAVDYYRCKRGVFPTLLTVEPIEADPLAASIRSPDGRPRKSQGNQETCMSCLNCATPSLPAWPRLREGIRVFLSVPDAQAVRAETWLAKEAGLETTPSGAAGLAGLFYLLESHPQQASALGLTRESRVLVVVTE